MFFTTTGTKILQILVIKSQDLNPRWPKVIVADLEPVFFLSLDPAPGIGFGSRIPDPTHLF
jgi:hypothetical protein